MPCRTFGKIRSGQRINTNKEIGDMRIEELCLKITKEHLEVSPEATEVSLCHLSRVARRAYNAGIERAAEVSSGGIDKEDPCYGICRPFVEAIRKEVVWAE